jgi:hypothetical protein
VSRISAAAVCLLAFGFAVTYANAVQAAFIERSLDFTSPEIRVAEGVSTVSVSGCPEVGLPGEPLLPAYGMCVLLPQGEEVAAVTATLVGETEITLEARLECAERQYPLSLEGPYQQMLPDETIYGSFEPFPAQRVVHVTTEVFRGYALAYLRVYPISYVGSRKALLFAPTVKFTIETRPSDRALTQSLRTLRAVSARDITSLGRLTDDVSEAGSYQVRRTPGVLSSIVNPGDSYPYVIITNSTLQSVFAGLRDLKDEQGYKTKIILVSDISANYAGSDLQAKIRNFIIDAYENWETEFVLLGGDDDIIPHRGLYADAGGTIDTDIAADLYYMALDGNWNTDGDGYWGEPAEADLIPEISCGRAAVGTVTEATNFVNKIVKYERTPVTGQIKNALMVGELLWDDPTWGCDYKDEVKNGSTNHGYTTVGFPPSFNVSTLYDRDLNPDSWDKEDLLPLMNGGRHIINHLGHANTAYGLRMYNSDVETRFTNNGVSNTYNIIYTQGCYSGSFDNRTSGGSYTDDCIGEHFCLVPNAAVAFVGNTRYGWGAHASTRGASQYYDRQFFDAIFGENLTLLGLADVDSRVDNIPFIDATSPGRWVYYELVVLGDPAMDIWTDVPGTITAIHPETIYVGQNEVAVRVLGSAPIEGARVSMFTDSTYSSGYTNAQGYAYVDPMALQAGEVSIAVSAHNFYAYHDTIDVVEASEAYLVLADFPIDDDDSGGSSGNANGGIDAGETIESVITLRNIGQVPATGVEARLRCENPHVTLLDTTATFPAIASGETQAASGAVRFAVDPEVPDGEMLNFEVYMACADTAATGHVSFAAMAPVLSVGTLHYYDSIVGNSDGCIEPGETFELYVMFVNHGSGAAEDVSILLSSSDPYVTVTQDSSFVPVIPGGGQGETSPAFVVRVDLACPAFHEIGFDLDLEYASGRQASGATSVMTGGLLTDDMEGGQGPWTHYVVNDTYFDEWHLETYRNHTGGGAHSWKCGGAGSATYTDYSNGALVTPELCLGPDASLSFWHYMDAELYGGGTPPYAWDGGIVEISTDGGYSWTQITPQGGYSHRIYPNDASPFPAETPCYAATAGWEQEVFDLSLYSGAARIRFQFGSDGYVTEEGWYIDDVEVTADLASVRIDPDQLEPVPAAFALRMADKNPVVSGVRVSFDVPSRAPVAIGLFDVTGRSVGTLVDSVLEPGTYSREWDAGRLAAGVYFLRMKAPGFEKVHKMVKM